MTANQNQSLERMSDTLKRLPILSMLKKHTTSPECNDSEQTTYTTAAKIAAEKNFCLSCQSLSDCQYTAIGNTGFQPLWNQWTPTYPVLQECRHKARQTKQARRDRLFESSGLPISNRNLQFKDCQNIKQSALQALRSAPTGLTKQFYLRGSTNTGKTQVISSFGNYLINNDIATTYLTAPELALKVRYKNEDYLTQLDELSQTPALLIDDLGEERSNPYVAEQLEIIISRRLRTNKITIVTSEYRAEQLLRHYNSKRLTKQLQSFYKIQLKRKEMEE